MEQSFDLRVYIDLLKRRFFHVVIPASLIFAAVCVVTYQLPPVYESTATILVESQQIPANLARSTVTGAADERIRIIEQRLMTRENILDIVRKFNLYQGDTLSPTDMVTRVRDASTIGRIVAFGGGKRQPTGRAIAFTVSFQYENAAIAARVANEFSTRILEQNIQSRSDRAAQTHEFFTRLVNQLEAEMAEQSARIVAFKKANKDTLPETLDIRRGKLTELQSKLSEVSGKYNELDRQLTYMRSRGVDTPTADASTQLSKLQNELVQLRAFYTDSHPSVKKVLVQINALENAAQPKPRPKPEQGDNGEGVSGETADQLADSPRIALMESEMDALRDQKEELGKEIAVLEASIDKTTETGVALSDMERELNNARAEYRGVIAKRVEAQTGEQLEEDRQAERFEIIDRAAPSSVPIKPEREKIILAGFFGSGAIGVGFALLLEIMSTGIRTSTDLMNKLRIQPIVSIPYIETREERKRRHRRWMIIGMLILVVPPVLLALIHFYYKPLDILGYSLLRKVGL